MGNQRFLAAVVGVGRRAALLLACSLLVVPAARAQTLSQLQGPDFGTYSIGTVSISLRATGGSGPGTYSWSVIRGALPPGVSLRSDVPSWYWSDTNFGLMGVATTPGTYTFTLRVTSGGQVADRDCTLRIRAQLLKDYYWALPAAFVGVPFSYTLTALNTVGSVTWTAAYGLPAGMTLSSSGELAGTPTASGSYWINVQFADDTQTVGKSVRLQVYDIRITTPGQLPNAIQYEPYSLTLEAAGGTPPYTFTSSYTSPVGLALDPTGVLSGTPTYTGQQVAWITATDSRGVSFSKYVWLHTLGVPPALPRIGVSKFSDCRVGDACRWGVSASDGGTAPFSWSAAGLPPGMSIRSGDGVAPDPWMGGGVEMWGTPTQAGTFDVQLTATDADGFEATSPVFAVHVSSLWDNLSLPSGTMGAGYKGGLYVSGGRGPYTVTPLDTDLPAGVTFDPATLTISGTPQESGYFYPSFLFTDADGETLERDYSIWFSGGASSTIYITTSRDLGTATVGSSFSRQLSACCVPSYAWSLSSGSLPPGISLAADGRLNGMATTEGTYAFFVRATDAANTANSAIRQFTLRVVPVSTGPSFYVTTSYQLPFGNIGSPYNLTFAASGGTGGLTWSLEPYNYLPPGLTLGADGVVSGTPTGGGQFYFWLRVTDEAGRGATASFRLSIYRPGEIPPLALPLGPNLGPYALGSLQLQLSASGGVPPYRYSPTPGADVVPGMRVQDGQPLPSGYSFPTTGAYLGVLDTPGVFHPSIRVTDSAGQTFDRNLTVTVTPLQLLSQSSPPRATVGVPYSFTLTLFGGSGSYSWAYPYTSYFLPAGLAIDSAGRISGTPTAAGNYTVYFTATDLSTSATLTFSISLIVDPFEITTGGVLPPAVVGTPYSYALSAPGCGGACAWSGSPVGGLTLSADGVVSGTPQYATSGSFTVTAKGSNGTVSKVFWLQILSSAPEPLSIGNSASLGPTTLGSMVTTRLSASGGTPPYAWSLLSGDLPVGITLQGPGETLGRSSAPGGTYLAGRAMRAGDYAFALSLTDGTGTRVTRSFTWTVTPVALGYSSLPVSSSGKALVYGQPYSQPLLAYGGTNRFAAWAANGPMPPGLSLDPLTGVVSGTPSNTGSFSVPIRVTDDAGHAAVGTLSINIASPTGTTLGFSTTSFGTRTLGSSASWNVTPTGGTAPYTVTAVGDLPPGFALQSGDSALGYAPGSFILAGVALAAGNFSITLRAEDSLGNIGVRTFPLVVAPFAVLDTSLVDASVGVPYSRSLAMLGNSSTVTWSVLPAYALPPGITLSPAGVMGGTPTQAGTFSFGLAATDVSGVVVNYYFTLRVSAIAVTDPAVLPSATQGVPYTYAFTGTGGASTRVWSATGLPSGLTLSADGVLSGTPSTSGGPFQLYVTVTDGVVPFNRSFALSIISPNPAQLDVAISDTTLSDVTVNAYTTRTLSASGGAPPYRWSVAAGSTLPPGMQLLSGDALPSYTPGTTVLAGMPTTVGLYTFDLVATDAAGQQVRRSYRLNVSAIGIAGGSPATATVGASYAQRFTAVGGTPPYTFAMALSPGSTQDVLPPGLAFSEDGLISGTPTSTGSFSFVLTVQDSAGRTFTRSYSVTARTSSGLYVSSSNPQFTWVGRRHSATLGTSGGSSSSTYAWSVVSGSLPPGLALTPASDNRTMLSGWHTRAGTFTFTLRATDSANSTNYADRVFTHRVSPVQLVSPPVAIVSVRDLPSGQVGAPYAFALKAAGGTPPYTFSESPSYPMPPGLTLGDDGVLSGAPQSPGVFYLQPVIADSAGATLVSPYVLTLVVSAAGKPSPLVRAGSSTLPHASAGAPFAFAPDRVLRGGTAPFTWSLAPESTLPAGLRLMSGGNGLSDYLGGVPSTPGDYTFALAVTDATGQTLTMACALKVSALSVTPESLPPGLVGAPYFSSLVVAGGSPPYSLGLTTSSDLPPGLSLSQAGLLSGTPTDPGNFNLQISVTDSAGDSLVKTYPVTIDNAAGQAPAITLSPKPVSVYYTKGAPAPSPVSVAVSSTSGNLPFTALLTGVPGASLSAGSGSTPSALGVNLDVATLAAGSYVGLLGVSAPDSANLYDVVPVTLTVAPAPACTYSVEPATASVPATGGTGNFTVATGAGCSWVTTGPPPSLVQIITGASGTGVGTVSYSVAPNTGTSGRTLTIRAGGQAHSVFQFGSECSFAISPAKLAAPAAGGQARITVTPSLSECGWTASGLDAAPASGTGGGETLVTIPPNLNAVGVTHTATIAGRTLTVAQAGLGCSVGLSPYNASSPAVGGQGSVEITTPAGCSYETTASANWVSVTSGGSGAASGTLVYSVEPNSTTAPRSATLTIGGQVFVIAQAALACSVTVNTSALGSPFGPSATTGSITVTTNGSNCAWAASSADAWATVTPASGKGNGTIGVLVGSNATSTSERTTELTIAGQTVAIRQAGTACTYGLQSPTGTVPAAGGRASVGVVTAAICGWTAVSNDPAWLTIVSSGNAGATDVRFAAAPNPSQTPRTGTLTIAGITYTVTQPGGECPYTLTAPGTPTSVSRDGATGTFGFSTTATGCAPKAVSYVNWVSTTTAFDGTAGTVTYVVAANPSGSTRVGTIQLGTQTFTISQGAAQCAYSLNAYGAAFDRFGGSASFLGSPSALGCTPVTGTDQPSFIVLDPLTGPVLNLFTQPFSVLPYDLIGGGGVRTGRITFGGQFFTVKQSSW